MKDIWSWWSVRILILRKDGGLILKTSRKHFLRISNSNVLKLSLGDAHSRAFVFTTSCLFCIDLCFFGVALGTLDVNALGDSHSAVGVYYIHLGADIPDVSHGFWSSQLNAWQNASSLPSQSLITRVWSLIQNDHIEVSKRCFHHHPLVHCISWCHQAGFTRRNPQFGEVIMTILTGVGWTMLHIDHWSG